MIEPTENPYQSPMAPPGDGPPPLNAALPAIISGVTTFVSTFLIVGVIALFGVLALSPAMTDHPGRIAVLGLCSLASLAAALLVGRHVYRDRKRVHEQAVRLYQQKEQLRQDLERRRDK